MIWKFDATDGRAAGTAKAALLKRIRSQAGPSADLVLFELVFSELVGNVARHAPKIAAATLEWQDGGAVLHVSDSGPGFSHKTYLPQNPLSESGRGLFLVENMSKKLQINCLPGGGSRVSVWLPIYRLAEPSLSARPESAYSLG
ncbi:MAG: ATP-binding protein [Candidatus Aquilonibacter sp.]